MAVRIRLKRMGKIHAPFYRVVVMDSRSKRDGEAIEEIGKYHPTEQPSRIVVDSPRVQYWLGQGAQPTEAVLALLKVTGDWQRFQGIDGGEGTLQVAPAKKSKRELYDAAVAAAGKSTLELKGQDSPRRKPAAKSAEAPEAAETRKGSKATESAKAAEAPKAPKAAPAADVAEPADTAPAADPAEGADVAAAPATEPEAPADAEAEAAGAAEGTES